MQKNPKPLFLAGTMLMLAMLAFLYLTLFLSRPPEVVERDAPETEFSAERAWSHLEVIGAVKNPIGSEGNLKVRNYIIEQLKGYDLEPELHQTTFYDSRFQRVADLGNVLARIPGTGSGKAILFMGHYDTVPDAYGASDNGSAVSAMLELIRLLQHHPQLKNDLIFFFPDGEEVGLLGARAFLKEHPWADDIAFVVNLEARGTAGQSFMFETGYDNLKTIEAFAEFVPHPTANSISYEVYTRMPNDTDFTPFKQRGYQGLNFAYIENLFDYHTAGDNLENTDIRSLQHHGSNARAIALQMGQQELPPEASENAVYFNTLGYGFAHYPYTHSVPIAAGVILLFVLMLFAGSRKNILNPFHWLRGILAFLIYLFLLYIIISSIYALISGFYPGSQQLLLNYNQNRLTLGFASVSLFFGLLYFRYISRGVCFTHAVALFVSLVFLLIISGEMSFLTTGGVAASSALLFVLFQKPLSPYDAGSGALIVFTLLMAYSAAFIPGASYLPTWPLAAAAAGYLIIFLLPKANKQVAWPAIILFLASLPVIALFSPLIRFFWVAMGLQASAIAALVIGLMTAFLIPQFEIITRRKPFIFPGIFLAAGLVMLVAGSAWLRYDERHRKPVNIKYVHNAETGIARWVSSDKQLNEWSERFLTEDPDTIYLTDFFPFDGRRYLAGPALDDTAVHAPAAELLHDTIVDRERIITLNVHPGSPTALLHLYLHSGETTLQVQLENKPLRTLLPRRNSHWHHLRYFAPPEEGFRITVRGKADEPLELKLTGVAFETPKPHKTEEMPSHMMPRGHSTMATRHYNFDTQP